MRIAAFPVPFVPGEQAFGFDFAGRDQGDVRWGEALQADPHSPRSVSPFRPLWTVPAGRGVILRWGDPAEGWKEGWKAGRERAGAREREERSEREGEGKEGREEASERGKGGLEGAAAAFDVKGHTAKHEGSHVQARRVTLSLSARYQAVRGRVGDSQRPLPPLSLPRRFPLPPPL
eukprot:2062527-Rhodomonas_salina.1